MQSERESTDKIERVLGIYSKLLDGSVINKAEEAVNYGVNERSIQRDIDDIRNFMDQSIINSGIANFVVYDRQEKGYRLEQNSPLKFSNSETLAICKILLDSRAFTKKEMENMLKKLIRSCVPESNRKTIADLVGNEIFHYIELQHKSIFIDKMWEIGQAIRDRRYIEIKYNRLKGKTTVLRRLKPVAIMFSEYYFYMAAFIEDEKLEAEIAAIRDFCPTIYRIDRISQLKVLDDRFRVPYKNRFEEGEFRKRVQFMHGGKLRRIKFRYSGISIEAILDKLPTAQIISETDGQYIISAEVFGDGIDMWIGSQGKNVEVLEDGI